MKKQLRGYFIPARITSLYETRKINGEELALLGKITALQHVKFGGCIASNKWLSEWWGKSRRWVSDAISKFVELKVISSSQNERGRRVLKYLLESPVENGGIEQNFHGGWNKTSMPTYKKNLQSIPAVGSRPTERCGETSLIPENEMPGTKLSPAVRLFRDFSRKRELHVFSTNISGDIVYNKGGKFGGWQWTTLLFWEKKYRQFVRLKVAPERFDEVLRWWINGYDDLLYAPRAKTMSAFIDKFTDMERAFKRDQLEKKKRNGEANERDHAPVKVIQVDTGRVRYR